MKTYDIAFLIGSIVTLSVLSWDKIAIEALFSGATIGAYVAWRITRK